MICGAKLQLVLVFCVVKGAGFRFSSCFVVVMCFGAFL